MLHFCSSCFATPRQVLHYDLTPIPPHPLLSLSLSYMCLGPVNIVLLTPNVTIVDPPDQVTFSVNASGIYNRIEYFMNGVLFSLNGSTNFSVQESNFDNFFQTLTYSGDNIDAIGGVYEIRLVHNTTLDFGNVDSVTAYVVPFGKSTLVASII